MALLAFDIDKGPVASLVVQAAERRVEFRGIIQIVAHRGTSVCVGPRALRMNPIARKAVKFTFLNTYSGKSRLATSTSGDPWPQH